MKESFVYVIVEGSKTVDGNVKQKLKKICYNSFTNLKEEYHEAFRF